MKCSELNVLHLFSIKYYKINTCLLIYYSLTKNYKYAQMKRSLDPLGDAAEAESGHEEKEICENTTVLRLNFITNVFVYISYIFF